MLLGTQQSLSQITKKASLGLKADTQSIFANSISVNTSIAFGNITTAFNNQLNGFLNDLNAKRAIAQSELQEQLTLNPLYKGLRGRGISLAWEYEQADIMMGGRGTVEGGWNDAEIQQIRETGKAKVYDPYYGVEHTPEGHHINNVADHVELQADPDNIRFYKTRDDHVNKGHGGNTSNPSNGDLIDKNAKLTQTNRYRVFRNELRGVALSAGIGFGIGFALSTVAELAMRGLSSIKISELLFKSTITGLETAIISTIGYGAGRLATLAIQKLGVNVLTKTGSLINFGAVGLAAISVISIYQYAKLRLAGMTRDNALSHVGKQSLYSISILSVSILAQGIYGGYAGIIVSTSVGLVYFCLNLSKMIAQRDKAEKLRVDTIISYKELMLK